jgi:hypothetical protein
LLIAFSSLKLRPLRRKCCRNLLALSFVTKRAGRIAAKERRMIRKLRSGEYRLYSRKVDPRTGKRRNLGTFGSRAAAEKHERQVQFFKRRG